MAIPSEKRLREPLPNEEQRLFVCAAAAVGLTAEQICHIFPRGKGRPKKMTPERLTELFPDELKASLPLVAQMVMFRLLQSALLGDPAAELAVFEMLGDWRQLLSTAEEAPEPDAAAQAAAQR
jgi:hypothetical protein